MKIKWKQHVGVLLAAAMLFSVAQTTFAYTVPVTIRIGLTANTEKESIPISNTELSLGHLEGNRFYEEESFRSASGFTVSVTGDYYLAVDVSFRGYSEALSLAEELQNLGYTALPAYLGDMRWTVYVRARSYESGVNAVTVLKEDSGYNSSLKTNVEENMLLTGKGGELLVFAGSKPQFAGTGSPSLIQVGGRSYRGVMEFGRYNVRNITAVNVIGLEEYLYSAVPSEMPKSWEAEALKAQAVTARTYTLSKLSQHAVSGYSLCDGTHCQVYLGYEQEAEPTTNAVDATSGKAMYYDGSPINAVYSSSAGGVTASSENVWSATVPYLRSVSEIAGVSAKEWNHTYTASQLSSMASAAGVSIGHVTDVVIEEVADGGRIQALKVVGTSGTWTVRKEEIRTALNLESRVFTVNGVGSGVQSGETVQNSNTASGETILVTNGAELAEGSSSGFYAIGSSGTQALSGAVTVLGTDGKQTTYGTTSKSATGSGMKDATTGSTQDGSGTYVFIGRGWGHGVGLSQYGAKSMAQAGYGWQDILKHYYTNITIE